MHHANHFVSANLERGTGSNGGSSRHMQTDDCRERLLSNKIAGGEKRDCGFLSVLRNDRKPRPAFLEIENRVCPIPLAKEGLLRLQSDYSSPKSGIREKCVGIEWRLQFIRQITTSL